MSVRINRKGIVTVKLTGTMMWSLSLLCAASLFEEGETEGVRALYNALPSRASLMEDWSGGRFISGDTRTIKVSVEILPTLRVMLERAEDGGWSTRTAYQRRIVGIDKLPALQLLATAGE